MKSRNSRPRPLLRQLLALTLFAAVSTTGAACGGGGGGGGTPTEPGPQPPPTNQGLSYTPSGTPGGGSLALARTNTGDQVLVLDLEARSVNGVYGLYFDLDYPAAVLDFDSASEGTLLNADGSNTSFQVADQNGRVVVAISRLGQVGPAGGTGTVLTLRFRAIGNGNGAMSFSRNAAETSDNREIATTWIGGTVQVNL